VSVSEDERLHKNTLKVWDLSSGQLIRTLSDPDSFMTYRAVTGDGRCVISASWDGTLRVWDVWAGQIVRTLHGHSANVADVAVTADGRLAVSVSEDKTLKVWDLSSGLAIATLEATAPLSCCAVSSSGTTLVAGDETGAVHLIDWLHAKHGRALTVHADSGPSRLMVSVSLTWRALRKLGRLLARGASERP
jgi:WD40 repeat protein